ncbi:MAG: LysR family transcriptional regulator [Mesorhizobium sp.]|nr:MAG: LysR family transcriptional regulator [Mesorhizobium sp.]
MDIRKLKAFIAVMDSGLISRAADEIGVTQPAISKTIKAMEEEVGVTLFERAKGRLNPTPEALYLRNVANSIVNQLNDATRFLTDYGNMQVGDLRVLSIPGPSLFFLPKLIREFVPRDSEIRTSLLSWSSSAIINWISNHQSGIGLVEVYEPNSFLAMEKIDVRCHCAVPAGHHLADKSTIFPKDLEDENLALIVSDHPLFVDIQKIFRDEGCSIRAKFQSDLFVPQFNFIEAGDCVGIVDAISVQNYHLYSQGNQKIVFRKFEPRVDLKVSVVYPSIRPLSRVESEFKKSLVHALQELS